MIGYIYNYLIFFYSMVIMGSYLWLVIKSYRMQKRLEVEMPDDETIKYMLKGSPLTPPVSIIAPAYNEEINIVENVKSLLSIDYPDFEVIIVNDGSTDDTLLELENEFDLQEIPYNLSKRVPCSEIKRVFKSKINDKLIVVDKVNGGRKSNSSNAGINVCKHKYFVCTDADCIIDPMALYRMMWLVISSHEPMIGVSATMLMSNDCDIDSIKEINYKTEKRKLDRDDKNKPRKKREMEDESKEKKFPSWYIFRKYWCKKPIEWILETPIFHFRRKNIGHPILPVFQQLEYMRSFLIGKLGWSAVNALPNISGGFGLFDTEVAIKAGGYDNASQAEDMDMLLRMVTYMKNNGREFRVAQVPQVCCWTKGPVGLKGIFNQRKRWGRGLCEIIVNHIEMMGRKHYGTIGAFTLPYLFVFEFLAVIIEFIGFWYFFLFLWPNDAVNMETFWIVLSMIYLFSVMMTFVLIFFDYRTKAVKWKHRFWRYVKFVITSLFEPLYHLLILHITLVGYILYLFNKGKKWATIER